MLFPLSAIIISYFLTFLCLVKATPAPRNLQPLPIVPRAELSPAEISIDSVSSSGTGPTGKCDGVNVSFAPNSYNIVITYSTLHVFTGMTGSTLTWATCNVKFTVNHPSDWALGLDSLGTVNGKLDVRKEHDAYMQNGVQYGSIENQSSDRRWLGPINEAFSTEPFNAGPIDFSGCPTGSTRTEFTVTIWISVTYDRQNHSSMDVSDQTLNLQWDPCPP